MIPPDGAGEGGEFQKGGFGEGGRVGEQGAVVGEDAVNGKEMGVSGVLTSNKKAGTYYEKDCGVETHMKWETCSSMLSLRRSRTAWASTSFMSAQARKQGFR